MTKPQHTQFTPDDYCILVYQGGIANVFKFNPHQGKRHRVMQTDFQSAANYVRGVRACGVQVQAAWCNEAGDIAKSVWNYEDFDFAPFNESFAGDILEAGAYLAKSSLIEDKAQGGAK